MKRKALLLALGLLMLLSAHLHLCCRMEVEGRELAGLYTLAQARNCRLRATEMAREIVSGEAELPEAKRRLVLTLRRPDGDQQELTEALLLSAPGVTLADAVIVNGTQIGTVEDGKELFAKLRESIENQMPNTAAVGNLSGKLQTTRVFTREGSQTNYKDMILLITGMAPVIYVDSAGRLC